MSNEVTPDKKGSTNSPKVSKFWLIFLALFALFFIVVSLVVTYLVWLISPPEQVINNETQALQTVATFFGGIAIVINAYFSAQRAQAMDKTAEGTLQNAQAALKNAQTAQINAQIAEDKQITERFSKAIEQLGSDKIEVRLGAIYTLERIAKDSPKDYWTIMEVLTAFVRHNAAVEDEELSVEELQNVPRIPLDIQESLTVIGRREHKEQEKNLLNLSNINIIGANLSGANLSGTNLAGANLAGANLSETNLAGAKLAEANLAEANLKDANLKDTNLFKVNLKDANLFRGNLSRAILFKADFCGANLSKTNLQGTKNLTPEQIKVAINYKDAEYDEDFLAQLDL